MRIENNIVVYDEFRIRERHEYCNLVDYRTIYGVEKCAIILNSTSTIIHIFKEDSNYDLEENISCVNAQIYNYNQLFQNNSIEDAFKSIEKKELKGEYKLDNAEYIIDYPYNVSFESSKILIQPIERDMGIFRNVTSEERMTIFHSKLIWKKYLNYTFYVMGVYGELLKILDEDLIKRYSKKIPVSDVRGRIERQRMQERVLKKEIDKELEKLYNEEWFERQFESLINVYIDELMQGIRVIGLIELIGLIEPIQLRHIKIRKLLSDRSHLMSIRKVISSIKDNSSINSIRTEAETRDENTDYYSPDVSEVKRVLKLFDPTKSLDRETKRYLRIEQHHLRVYLFGKKKFDVCGICGKEYPVSLLVVAHIKYRKPCTNDERLDKNVIMPMCRIGCDILYEQGYITVVNGKVETMDHKIHSKDLLEKVSLLKGKECPYWNDKTKKYFEWHTNFHMQ